MLTINELHIRFLDQQPGNETVHGIDFSMKAGEFLGLCGESGSGKTLTALAIAGLTNPNKTQISGEILFQGVNLLTQSPMEMQQILGRDIAMVFQEPASCLNPLRTIGWQMEEMIRIHKTLPKNQRKDMVISAMEEVELENPLHIYKQYPHELSGGMRQRIMLAMAFIHRPKLLICDEPTTALDTENQNHILHLLEKIGQEKNIGILFISHDLKLISRLCHRVLVMHEGKIIEQGSSKEIFQSPKEHYTKMLVSAANWEA